ncbi:hypothetical protein LIER_05963 [Lithospermum erythrorhizon]|uniref:Uncharacterized protein n=1 Tax=Lithospermum erythrorhizon TaxID=34254 RepID=A0AAV3P3T0_LITER
MMYGEVTQITPMTNTHKLHAICVRNLKKSKLQRGSMMPQGSKSTSTKSEDDVPNEMGSEDQPPTSPNDKPQIGLPEVANKQPRTKDGLPKIGDNKPSSRTHEARNIKSQNSLPEVGGKQPREKDGLQKIGDNKPSSRTQEARINKSTTRSIVCCNQAGAQTPHIQRRRQIRCMQSMDSRSATTSTTKWG